MSAPPRPLGQEGLRLWERVWALQRPWIEEATDLDFVALLCESMDERVMLRVSVLQTGAWRDRVALRQLDGQIADLMAGLGLNPTDRRALAAGIVEENSELMKGGADSDNAPNAQSALDELRARRSRTYGAATLDTPS